MKKKVKLQFIADNAKRKACFRKRKNTFMKAAKELSTLCGIEVAAIVYSPYSSEPDVWPDEVGVQNTLSKLNRMPDHWTSMTMLTQETFLQECLDKVKQKLDNQRAENHEMQMTQLMFQSMAVRELTGLSLTDLSNLNSLLGRRIDEIGRRLQNLDSKQSSLAQPDMGSALATEAAEAATAPFDGSVHVGNDNEIPYWSNKYFPN